MRADFGIISIGAYIPRRRLQRAVIHQANSWFAPNLRGLARGEKAIVNWDEDAVTMAVDAARDCLVGYAKDCLLYTSPSPRDLSTSRMPSSA